MRTFNMPFSFGAVAAVASAPPSQPVFAVQPSFSGTVAVDSTLTGNDGTIIFGTVSARQWLRNGVAISGATASTYVPVVADLGANLSYRVKATGAGGETTATSPAIGPVVGGLATITAVNANGWQVTDPDPVDLSLARFMVDYDGFDDTGAAVTQTVQRVVTKRVRNVFPNQATFTADQVAADDYIYQGAVISGVTNNSTVVSPKPIATWGMMDRTLVGNSIYWEIIPFHRDAQNGRQVACVEVQATDGTNTTAWQAVSTTGISTYCEDGQPVEVFSGTLDISALNNDATITLRGRVKPWLGVTASILDSQTETEFRFTNRFFYKNTTLAAAPSLIYVSSTGTDATAVVSTDPATAAATPALTVGGAIGRLRSVLGTGSVNTLSGAEIRIVNGVSMGSVAFNFDFRIDGAAIKVTRAPGTSRAAANITWATGNTVRLHTTTNTGAVCTENSLIFEDVTITRLNDVSFTGEAARRMYVQFRNVALNFSSASAFSGMMNNSDVGYFGLTVSNYATSGFVYLSAGTHRIIRGLVGDLNNTAMTGYNVIGCTIARARIDMAWSQRGALVYQNRFSDTPGGSPTLWFRTQTLEQTMAVAVVQNVAPLLRNSNVVNLRLSGDSDFGQVVHAVVHHNTTPGDGIYGRWNLFYDEGAQPRTHSLVSFKGNLGPQLNTKGDVFAEDGTRIGNFQFYHGVGCSGTFTEDVDAAGGVGVSFRQDYGGFNSVIAGGDPLYVDDRAITLPGPVAGSTGGNYRLQSGSPAKSLFVKHLLGRDFEGNARALSGAVDAGAYA